MFCPKCKVYTMHDKCPKCSAKVVKAVPPKFSPVDKYDRYRREAKREELKAKGLA